MHEGSGCEPVPQAVERRLLLSLIGTGDYRPCCIRIPWQPQAERDVPERYHQLALARALEPTRTWLIGTVEAREKHAAPIPHDRFITIPHGLTDEDCWILFDVIASALDDLGEGRWGVHLDVTHGFRVQPMILLSAIRYATRLNGSRMHLEEVYYHALGSDQGASSTLRKAGFLLEMENIAQDIHVFLAFASAGPLSQRLGLAERNLRNELLAHVAGGGSQAERNRRMGEEIHRRPDIGHLQQLRHALDAFGAMVGINHTPAAAATVRTLCDLSLRARQLFTGPLAPIGRGLDRMQAELRRLLPANSEQLWGWHVALARWCLERGLDQQALTHAEEVVVTRICEDHGRSPLERQARDELGEPLKAMAKHEARVPEAWQALISAWSAVSASRHEVNHAFTNAGSEHGRDRSSAKIQGLIKVRIEELLKANDRLTVLPALPTSSRPLDKDPV